MSINTYRYDLIIAYVFAAFNVDTIIKISYNSKKGGKKMFDAIMIFILDVIDLIKVIIGIFG